MYPSPYRTHLYVHCTASTLLHTVLGMSSGHLRIEGRGEEERRGGREKGIGTRLVSIDRPRNQTNSCTLSVSIHVHMCECVHLAMAGTSFGEV